MKRKVPGLDKSHGMSAFTLFPAGKYVFQFAKHSEKEAKNGLSTIHSHNLKCLGTLEEKAECKEMTGKMYFHRMIEMHDDHPSYDQWSSIFVDELKTMADCAGIPIGKGGEIDDDDFSALEKTIIGNVVVKDGQDASGDPRKENSINMWYPDEGKPAAPKKASAKKASAKRA